MMSFQVKDKVQMNKQLHQQHNYLTYVIGDIENKILDVLEQWKRQEITQEDATQMVNFLRKELASKTNEKNFLLAKINQMKKDYLKRKKAFVQQLKMSSSAAVSVVQFLTVWELKKFQGSLSRENHMMEHQSSSFYRRIIVYIQYI